MRVQRALSPIGSPSARKSLDQFPVFTAFSSKLLTWSAPLFYADALYWDVNLGKSLIYIKKISHGVRRPRRERTAAWLTGAAGI
jgi:hypothetical protein